MSKFIPITIVTVIIIAICLYFILIHNKTGFKKIEKFNKSKLLKENYKFGENIDFRETNVNKIPKQLYLTHHSKNKIPKKVYDNLDKYARINGNKINYKIYDNDEIIDFLSKYYNDVVVDKFKKLSGAHKADLFRYCLLYIKGGVYIDIKTVLIKPLGDIIDFDRGNTMFTVLGSKLFGNVKQIYQGIIATPPRNELIFKLIINVIETPKITTKINYLVFTKNFYKIAKKIKGDKLEKGLNKLNNHMDMYLFYEVLEKNCKKRDRYGVCSNIYDKGENIIKTRYDDYPWK
jgi:hypothetical protein